MTKLLLTDGDIEVFRWVWMLQVLSLDQIRRLRYFQSDTGTLSNLDNVRKRLARLTRTGYLRADDIWKEHTRVRQRIYRLGNEALPALRYHFGIDQTRVHKPKAQNTFRQVHHTLMVSECAVRIVECLRNTEFETPDLPPLDIPFYHTHAVGNPRAKKHIERFATQEDLHVPGHLKPFRIRPDLVFALGKGGTHRLFLLEADRGTESYTEITEKLRGYRYYAEKRDPADPGKFLWQRYGPVRDFRALFVTTTQKRMESLRASLSKEPGFGLAAFADFAQVCDRNICFEEVWKVEDGSFQPLLRGIQRSETNS